MNVGVRGAPSLAKIPGGNCDRPPGEKPMKTYLRMAAAVAAGLTLCVAGAAGGAQAQTAQRGYDKGPGWGISHVVTKTRMVDDYMAYLSPKSRQTNRPGKNAGY